MHLPRLQVLEAEIERLSYRDARSLTRGQQLVAELQQALGVLSRQREELASLYAIAKDLTAATDLGDLLQSLVDRAMVLVGAERGFVVLAEPGDGIRLAAARRFSAGEVAPTDEEFSGSLVSRVMQTGEPF